MSLSGEPWKGAIPLPLQIVIDDVGWWSGEDGSARHEPYRTGIGRHHVAADYEALAALGQGLGMRPMVAFVAAEWDREDLLRELPSSTWMGERWDNRQWVGPWLEESADILRRHRDHLELALHGLAHEYWHDGRLERTEFHDRDGNLRRRDEVVRHLEYFGRLLEQNGLGPFPVSFVPPASNHSFGLGEVGMQAVLRDFGVRFVTTRFASCRRAAPFQNPWIASECGVALVERASLAAGWQDLDPRPNFAFDQPTCALHWPNILHPDPRRNLEVVGRWVEHLRPFGQRLDGMLAADTKSGWTQTAYYSLADVTEAAGGFEIDVAAVQAVSTPAFDLAFTFKVEAPPAVRWSVAGGILRAAEFDPQTNHHVLRLEPEQRCLLLSGRICPPC